MIEKKKSARAASNMSCFATGPVLAFQGGVASSVGIALLVGAPFSERAFVGQVWTHAAQNGYMLLDRLSGDKTFAQMKQLQEK